MFKSLIAALLPVAALARGLDDGSSEENAKTISMNENLEDGIVMKVHTWNTIGGEDGKTRQLHGDTEVFLN